MKIVLKSGVQNSNIKFLNRLITSGLVESLWLHTLCVYVCMCVCFLLGKSVYESLYPVFSGKTGLLVFLIGV